MFTKRKSVLLTIAVSLCLLFSLIGTKTVEAAEASKERTLNYVMVNLEVSKNLTLKVNNLQSGDIVKYSTSNKEIVNVSSKGVCTGVTPGTATVTATIIGKDKSTTQLKCRITVKEMRIPTISDFKLHRDGDFIIGNSTIDVSINVDKSTTAVVSVIDSFDNVIYEKTITVKKNKPTMFTWNGLDSNGNLAEDDVYYIRVECDNAVKQTETFWVTDVCEFSGGNGSAKNPYQIRTIEEFRKMPGHNGCHFVLMNDIDAEYEALENLFSTDVPFNGTLNGNGYTIKNINNQSYIFAAIGEEGEIKNLTISGLISSGTGFAFAYYNYGKIEDVTILNMSLTGTGSNWAMGTIYVNYGMIKNCHFSGSIGSTAYNKTWGRGGAIGGIADDNQASGKIINCTSDFKFSVAGTGGDPCGLIVSSNAGTILYCSSSGQIIKGSSAAFGSIAGNNTGTVSGCYYTGSTTNVKVVGKGTGTVN